MAEQKKVVGGSTMIKVNRRTRFNICKISDVYFADSIEAAIENEDVIYFFQNREDYPNSEKFHTLHIDTDKSADDLLASFRDSTRKDIKKMERVIENEPDYALKQTDQPDEAEIAVFIEKYNEFACQKGIDNCSTQRLLDLAKNGCLYFSCISHRDRYLNMHALIFDGHRTRGLYSCSPRLDEEETELRSLMAVSNKYLTFMDMCFFQRRGIFLFDFGGMALDPEDKQIKGIDYYKLGFGKNMVEEYSFIYPITFKGRVYIFIRKWFRGNIS